LQRVKLAARDLQTLKNAAAIISRTFAEIRDLKSDITKLERDLESSGSLKTVEEVQAELDALTSEV
jgi:DNA repair protein RAD50